jgi:hypothetical protein
MIEAFATIAIGLIFWSIIVGLIEGLSDLQKQREKRR